MRQLPDLIVLFPSFPPKNAKLDCTVTSSPITVFPSAKLAQSEIWDENVRNVLRKPRYKKTELDQRRAQVSHRNITKPEVP